MSYYELPKDEVPDRNIWHHPQRLEEWFAAVEERRKNPDLQPVDSFDDVPGMTQNELTKGLRD